jgi:nitric oxide reductase activation protein
VIEQPAPAVPAASAPDPAALAGTGQLSRRLLAPLRGLTRPVANRARAADGDTFQLDALLGWCIARRCGQAPDARVYRASPHQAARAGVWLLLDRSASTAAPHGTSPGGGPAGTVLHAAARSVAAIAAALQALGVPCAVVAFNSNGRQAVRLSTVKAVGQPADGALASRLQALRPGGSTRLGAALRHATARLGAGRADARWVLLVSDGQPHDLDVHDPRYLVEDARHAVGRASQRGVRMACLTLGATAEPAALRIFGRRGTQTLGDVGALPQALRRLLG